MRKIKTIKTVFLVITRGFIIRNILRSGVLSHLTRKGVRVVIFFENVRGKPLSQALKKEFESGMVVVESPDEFKRKPSLRTMLYSVFRLTASFFVYSETTWFYSRFGNKKNLNRWIGFAYIERFFFSLLSKFPFIKGAARFCEQTVFYEERFSAYFNIYEPNMVFSTSIISRADIQFLKEAKKRGIKTVSMPKGWDNVTRMLYRVIPDVFIVQNEVMRADAQRVQQIPPTSIVTCGFPQFDWYRRPEIIMPREEFFKKIGLDPNRRLIFFGSEGTWAQRDHEVARFIAESIKKGVFSEPCSLLVRPHFSDVTNRRFDFLSSYPHVKIDENFTPSDFFIDNWKPGIEETKLFTNLVYYSDMLIATASTLFLDAACCNKPSIGIAYDAFFDPRTGKDVTADLYTMNHLRDVIDTGAVLMVRNDKELIQAIEHVLEEGSRFKEQERQVLLRKICFNVDGKSAERVAGAILSLIED